MAAPAWENSRSHAHFLGELVNVLLNEKEKIIFPDCMKSNADYFYGIIIPTKSLNTFEFFMYHLFEFYVLEKRLQDLEVYWLLIGQIAKQLQYWHKLEGEEFTQRVQEFRETVDACHTIEYCH
jgi:hypothetical protein